MIVGLKFGAIEVEEGGSGAVVGGLRGHLGVVGVGAGGRGRVGAGGRERVVWWQGRIRLVTG